MEEEMVEKSDLHKQYILELESELREFESKEEASTKRMKLMVYPAMVAFFILSSYGFYLISSLTNDFDKMVNSVQRMSNSMEPMAERVVINMDAMAKNFVSLEKNMGQMVGTIEAMSNNFTSVALDVKAMNGTIKHMSRATDNMAVSTHNMQYDMWGMSNSISKPLNMMNKFLPWGRSASQRQMPIPYGYVKPVAMNMPLTQTAPVLSE